MFGDFSKMATNSEKWFAALNLFSGTVWLNKIFLFYYCLIKRLYRKPSNNFELPREAGKALLILSGNFWPCERKKQ